MSGISHSFFVIMEMKGLFMKRRIIISLIFILIILITLPFVLIFAQVHEQGIFLISVLIIVVYMAIYIFGSTPKLFIYIIYGGLTALFLYLLQDYQIPIVMIATLIFVLNPLARFETYLNKIMSDGDVLPIHISFHGSKWPFYDYRKAMKNFYHLPQSRKLYTMKWYLRLRQLLMLLFIAGGIFLFINQINMIVNTLDDFNWERFFTFYMVTILFLLAWIIHLKGFTSMFRALAISLFPPVIYLVLLSSFTDPLRYSLAGSLFIITIVVGIWELVTLYRRVSYDIYQYYDVDRQLEVYANALFEPLVYNESYTLCADYRFKGTQKEFDRIFQDILVYANYFKFIIVAYAFGKDVVEINAHFHYRAEKRVLKFKTYLESKLKRKMDMRYFHDFNKSEYEQQFFHKPAFIIARTQHLAELLTDLNIRAKIIISFIVYFETLVDMQEMSKNYQLTPLSDLKVDEYLTARIDIQSINDDYVIETKVRDLLLNLMINGGTFVRVSVYY